MCNEKEKAYVYIPADLSHTKKARWDFKKIDKCIVSIIIALQKQGIYTKGCCCGHGKSNGEILLQDGRKLIIDNGTKEAF